jgi:hypothetical protein
MDTHDYTSTFRAVVGRTHRIQLRRGKTNTLLKKKARLALTSLR